MQKQYSYEGYEEADKDSKRLDPAKILASAKIYANKYSCDVGIWELTQVVKYPVPELEVVAVT